MWPVMMDMSFSCNNLDSRVITWCKHLDKCFYIPVFVNISGKLWHGMVWEIFSHALSSLGLTSNFISSYGLLYLSRYKVAWAHLNSRANQTNELWSAWKRGVFVCWEVKAPCASRKAHWVLNSRPKVERNQREVDV